MIEIPESVLARNSDTSRYTLYSKLQVELAQVITGAGLKLDRANNHQLYESLLRVGQSSPDRIVLTFNPEPYNAGRSKDRAIQSPPGFRFDSQVNLAYSFTLADWSDRNKNGEYTLQSSSEYKVAYQIATGQWLFLNGLPHQIPVSSFVMDSNSTGLVVSSEERDLGTSFTLSVTPAGELLVIAPTPDFLYRTRIVISHIKSFRRPACFS